MQNCIVPVAAGFLSVAVILGLSQGGPGQEGGQQNRGEHGAVRPQVNRRLGSLGQLQLITSRGGI